jgi:hypothetical protein
MLYCCLRQDQNDAVKRAYSPFTRHACWREGSVCRIGVLDRILAAGGYFNRFCSRGIEKEKK